MEVRCERCRAQYVFADDQVTEQGLTVRCSSCGHLFKVKRKALVVTLPVSAAEAAAEQPVSAAETARAAVQAAAHAVMAETERREWTLRQPGGQTYLFKDLSTLHRWIVERKAHREDEISRAGEGWRRLGAISELQSFFAVVEAAERATQTPLPASAQPTMLQYPATVFPGPGAPPPPSRTDQAFPRSPAAKAELPPATRARTEVAPPPPPPAGRTERAFPAQPASPAPRTEVAFPAQPAPAPPPPATTRVKADDLFTPAPMARPAELEAELAQTGAASLSPNLDTAQGFPPPPPSAPARPGGAAWERSGAAAPSAADSQEPAWTRVRQPASAVPDFGRTRRQGGGLGKVLAVVTVLAALGAAGAWYFLLRGAPPAPAPTAVAPVSTPAPEPMPPEPPRPALAAPVPRPSAPPAAPAAAPPPASPPGEPPRAAAAPAPAPSAAAPAAVPPPGEPPGATAASGPAPSAAAPAPAAPAPVAEPTPGQAAAPPPASSPPPAEEKPIAPAPAAAPGVPAAPAAGPARADPDRPKGTRELLAQARRLRDRGKTQQALEAYGQVLARSPTSPEAQAGRGWCYLELSRYAQATAAFQGALEIDPRSADALLGLAETYRYEGRRADAVRFYERYLVEHPDGEDAVAAQNAIRSLKE